MGRDKALLPLPDGRLLWERQLALLRQLEPAELWISGPTRPGFPRDVPLVTDERPNLGPLAGITAALRVLRSPFLLVLAIDLPAMTATFLRELLARRNDDCGVVPQHGGAQCFYEPLAAIYPRTVYPAALNALLADRLAMQPFVRALGEVMTPYEIAAYEEPLFSNWNSPAQVEE
jgi:molybdopterin-guanine dinucleotide biosynthesis protein A